MTIEEAMKLAHQEYLIGIGKRWTVDCDGKTVVIGQTKQEAAREYLRWLGESSAG
jgi:hypothetical protein